MIFTASEMSKSVNNCMHILGLSTIFITDVHHE
jgi:hypothetical protein